jgi:hypothetical protein
VTDRVAYYKLQAAHCVSMAAQACGEQRVYWLDMRDMWIGMAECVSVLDHSSAQQVQHANRGRPGRQIETRCSRSGVHLAVSILKPHFSPARIDRECGAR